jgi:predicted nucleic acid-binding protein
VTRVLLDTNVVLDVLASREPFAVDAEAVLRLIETETIQGVIAAHSITTLHYLLSKHLGKAKTRSVLSDLLRLLRVVAVDEESIKYALALNWADFEDAVQATCAESAEADFLITRDKTGFKKSTVRPVTPAEFLAIGA